MADKGGEDKHVSAKQDTQSCQEVNTSELRDSFRKLCNKTVSVAHRAKNSVHQLGECIK